MRFLLLVRVEGKDTRSVVRALTSQMRTLPGQLRGSLTWDRGTEMADRHQFTIATDLKVYFCDPQSPWQRGSNENTNGLPAAPVPAERHPLLTIDPAAPRRDRNQTEHFHTALR